MAVNGMPAKAFSISAPSAWNSLSYNCRSAELLSAFQCSLTLNCLILFTVNVNTQPSLCDYSPLIRWQHMALHKCVLIDRSIDLSIEWSDVVPLLAFFLNWCCTNWFT